MTFLPRTQAFIRHSWPTDMMAEVNAVEAEIEAEIREAEAKAGAVVRKDQYIASLKGAIEVIRREDAELLREAQSRYSTAVEALESIANGDGESALWAKQALSDLGLRS